MASSGSFSGSIKDGHYKVTVDWTQTKNTDTNKSTVKITVKFTNDWDLNINGRTDHTYSIDGQSGTFSSDAISSKATHSLGSFSKTVSHNSDGTKSLTITVKFKIKANLSGTYYEEIVASKTITLDSIPRASTVSAGSANVGSALKINISRASSSFQHRLWYKFDGVASTNWANITGENITATSYSWTIPTSFYKAMVTSKSKKGTILCRTYNSSGSAIGEATCSFTAVVPQAASLGTVTFSAVNTVSSRSGQILRGTDSVKTTTVANALNSATIKSIVVTNGGFSSSSTYSSESETKSYTFKNCASGSFKVVVTDSRGYQVTKTQSLTLISYIKPTVTIKNPKIDTTGRLTFSLTGTGFNGNIGSTTNSFSVKYTIKKEDGTTLASASITPTWSGNSFTTSTVSRTGLDYLSTYNIQGQIRDSTMESGVYISSKTTSVNCLPIFDWGKNDFRFNVPVYGDAYVSANNRGFYGKTTSGENKRIINISDNNNVAINTSGNGPTGTTNIYGGSGTSPTVNIGSNAERCAFKHNGYKITYDKGDSITLTNNDDVFAGFITGEATQLFFTIPINLPICAESVTFSGKIVGRSANGYIVGTTYNESAFNINTTSGHSTTASIAPTGIRVKCTFNSAIKNATNNRPCNVTPYGDLKITFS